MQDFYEEHVGKPEKLALYKKSVVMEHAQHVREDSPFTLSLPMQVRISCYPLSLPLYSSRCVVF